ncbi:MAG: MBOAT family O-acyltransferase, partial [Mucilaginibacter sp.]
PVPFLTFILPIGLSFHTFQAMSYTIEVYRGKQAAERHFGIYALYVMFYPQLVAGPIERPQNLLHQFREHHRLNKEEVKAGLLQMAFGLFKKVVIADRLALAVDHGFTNYQSQSGLSLFIAAVFYSFQIYCDFSGYSDIAIGAARCMGFKLMTNFNAPYFARSVTEFWKRWHISLSTWFKDYLYFPLGGSRAARYRVYFNIFVVFMVSGLWHGADWTFVIWGALHGLFVITEKTLGTLKRQLKISQTNNGLLNGARVLFTFLLVTIAWVFFRAPNIGQAGAILTKIFTFSGNGIVNLGVNSNEICFSFILIILLMLFESRWPKPQLISLNNYAYMLVFAGLLFVCYFFGIFNYRQFVYFQF